MQDQIIATCFFMSMIIINPINSKSISNQETLFLEQKQYLGMKIALRDPKPLEISQREESIFSLLQNEFENDKGEFLVSPTYLESVLSTVQNNRLKENAEKRGVVSELQLNSNATSPFLQNNNTDDSRKSKIMENEDDELFLPPSVLKQEEIMSIPSKRFLNELAKSKYAEQNVVLKHAEDKKRSLSLPKTLKIRIKVAYDQSFNDLIRSFNYSPTFILRYMTQLLKQIFQLPGLDTIIEPEVSTGN